MKELKEWNKEIRINVEVGKYGRAFRLTESFTYKARINGEIIDIIIPKGFVTDFASTPKALWWFFGPIGLHTLPAVVHDYMYTKHGDTNVRSFSKQQADRLFYDSMIAFGVNRFKAWSAYKAVKAAGSSHFGGEPLEFN